MKMKSLTAAMLITSVFLASCENNHGSNVGNVSTSSLITEHNQPIDQHVDVIDHHTTTPTISHENFEIAVAPAILGGTPDTAQDAGFILGISSSLLWAGVPFAWASPLAGVLGILASTAGILDAIFNNSNANEFGILQYQITDLQNKMNTLNAKVAEQQNIFYSYIQTQSTNKLKSDINDFYDKGYNYFAAEAGSGKDNVSQLILDAFADVDDMRFESMGDMTTKNMQQTLSTMSGVKALVNHFPQGDFNDKLVYISNTYIDTSTSYCHQAHGGMRTDQCFRAVKRSTNATGANNSALLSFLVDLNDAEQSFIEKPVSSMSNASHYAKNASDVFDSGNNYVAWYGGKALIALQQAYNAEFIANWINYTIGLKHHAEISNLHPDMDNGYKGVYQLKPFNSRTEGNTYYSYQLNKSEDDNKADYLKAQHNLTNIYSARASLLTQTLVEHTVSDHLYSYNPYLQSSPYTYSNKSMFDGTSYTYNEAKLMNSTIEAKTMLAKVMPLPVKNSRQSDVNKKDDGYFYIYNGLKSMPTCLNNYKKGLIKESDSFRQYCPSVYSYNKDIEKIANHNVYNAQQFSFSTAWGGQTHQYEHIGYRCDLMSGNHDDLFTMAWSRSGAGFSCYPNMDKDVINAGLNPSKETYRYGNNNLYFISHSTGISIYWFYFVPNLDPTNYNNFKPAKYASKDTTQVLFYQGGDPWSNMYYDGNRFGLNEAQLHNGSTHNVAVAFPYATDDGYITTMIFNLYMHQPQNKAWEDYVTLQCLTYDPLCVHNDEKDTWLYLAEPYAAFKDVNDQPYVSFVNTSGHAYVNHSPSIFGLSYRK